jgi:hypothetical protein
VELLLTDHIAWRIIKIEYIISVTGVVFVNLHCDYCTIPSIPYSALCVFKIYGVYPSGASGFIPAVFSLVRVAQSLAFYVMFCSSLFIILLFLLWSLC